MTIPESGTKPLAVIGQSAGVPRRRLALIKFMSTLALIVLAGIHTKAMADPQLKLHPVARGDTVVLGDLFDDAGPAATFAAFPAPKPGKSVYVDTARIAAAAIAGGIKWQHPRGVSRIRVTRDGTPVPTDTIINAVREEFLRRGVEDTLRITVDPKKATLFVPLGADTTVIVEGLDRKSRSGGFIARLYLPGALPGDQRVKIPGRSQVLKEIPVLAHRVPVGEEITEGDLRWVEMVVDRMGRGIIQEARELLGQSPRRAIGIGKPIRYRDVQKPVLVTKGRLIKVVVETPFMHLSTLGKAMDSGSHGDTIRVRNTSSRQIVQAVVDAHDRAHVPTAGGAMVIR